MADDWMNLGSQPRFEPPPPPPPPFIPSPDTPSLDGLDEAFPPLNDLDRKTRAYLRANGKAWEIISDMAAVFVRRDKPFSMKTIVEVVRWDYIKRATDPNSDFKLSNSYTSYIARILCHFWPRMSDLIQLNEVRRDQQPGP